MRMGILLLSPILKGCVSQGKSYEEALIRNIKEAIELYLEVLEADELAFLGREATIEFM